MGRKSIPINQELAKKIKQRRNELNLTIAEAAAKANVGIKTWCRYESGEAIRSDKYKGVCRALNWTSLPDESIEENILTELLRTKKHESWSVYIEKNFGAEAAASFAIGSDILLEYVEEDLSEIATLPKGSHIGQVNLSYLFHMLPQQFLMEYDYEFLYIFRLVLLRLRQQAKYSVEIIAHSVLEEIILYLIAEESKTVLEIEDIPVDPYFEDWVFDLFGDMDVITCLYSDMYIDEENIYHFRHWTKEQFYCSKS